MARYPLPFETERTILKNVKKQAVQKGITVDADFTERAIRLIADDLLNYTNVPEGIDKNHFLNNQKTVYNLAITLELLEHKMTSYYFESTELKTFFDQTEIRETDLIKEYVQEEGISITNDKGVSYSTLGFHLRFPDTPCLSTTFVLNTEVQVMALFIKLGTHTLFVENADDFISKYLTGEEMQREQLMVKEVFNFLFYILCFPEMVVDGKPRNIEKSTIVPFSPIRTIKIHKDIIEATETIGKRTRVTHFRRGHYRTLRSEYFTHKHNRCIFVHGAIVKGTPAKTVNTAEEIRNEKTDYEGVRKNFDAISSFANEAVSEKGVTNAWKDKAEQDKK